MKTVLVSLFCLSVSQSFAQLQWKNVDSLYQPLPKSIHVYYTDQVLDTAPFRAFYLVADLRDRKLDFTVDTSRDRRLTPMEFYKRNAHPLVVVNTTFFSYETNRSLNTVIMNGKLVALNTHSVAGRGKDTFTFRHPYSSAIGISKRRDPDIAWVYTDSASNRIYGVSKIPAPLKDSSVSSPLMIPELGQDIYSWKMRTAVGGGPVLLQNGEIKITNNEELKFAGKAINDKHPRTAMGYTAGHKIIILVIEGRNKVAHGATLQMEAQILKDLGCLEGINLDGGGSSCLLINGKETIKPSDSTQRPVPAVFIIKKK